MAFFAVLSIAPVLVTAISVYGAANTPEQALQQLSSVAGMLPADLQSVVADQLTTITAASTRGAHLARGHRPRGGPVDGDDRHDIPHRRVDSRLPRDRDLRFLRRSGLALVFVLGGALLLGGVIAAAGAVSRSRAGLPEPVRTVAPVFSWVALAVLMTVVLAVLYRYAPDRSKPAGAGCSAVVAAEAPVIPA